MQVKAWIQLDDLTPEDVSVQIYHGPIDTIGDITYGEVMPMVATEEKRGTDTLFTGTIHYLKSGRHGFTVRLLPNHPDLNSPFDMGLILWASDPVSVTA
jgi:starch phosphorylase